MEAKVREEYRRLSRRKLLQRVYDFGSAYEINSYSCSQCTVAALYRVLDIPEALVKAACSNAAGTAWQLVGTCGGLVGGIMVLDYFYGRPFGHMSDKKVIQDPNVTDLLSSQKIARLLFNKYIEEYGTITCADIQQQLYGRVFYLEDMQEFQKMEEAGGHANPEKAPKIVGNAARWTMEILLDKGAVVLGK
ncbi:MAG: C_GCAxxG_C_C family protein [Deltaproteobacteria bacterium]|nr:C_GCAxxG_C_C family protein [Deltaproteobacteria bacterium]